MPVAVAYNSQDISAFPQKVNDSAGVLACRVLVAGTNASEVKNAAGANAGKIIGVAGHDADNGADVSVYDKGLVHCVAASAIAVGDTVNIAGTTGKVKTVSEASTTVVYPVGIARSATTADNQYVKVQLQIGSRYTIP